MAHLIPIGNSLGIRIPKAILQQLGLKKNSDLDFKITKDGLLISPTKQSRQGWEEAFKKSHKEKIILGEKITNEFDRDEWEW